jgi:hypothetical protein
MWNEGAQVPQSLSPNERESTRTSGAAQVDFALESDSMLFWLGQPRSTNQDQGKHSAFIWAFEWFNLFTFMRFTVSQHYIDHT